MTQTKFPIQATPMLSALRRGVMLLLACLVIHCGGDPLLPGTPVSPTPELSLSPWNGQVAQGTAQQFSLRGIYPDGRARELQAEAVWQVVDAEGRRLPMPADGALELAAPGRYLVTAQYGEQTLTTPLVVTAAVLKSLAVSPSLPQVAKGATQLFTATASFSDGTTQDVSKLATWAVKDVLGVGVATIDTTGLLVGKSVGKATITARYKSKSAATTVEVVAATLTALAVTPAAPTIASGTNQRFAAIGSYSDGSSADLTAAVTWAVTDLVGSGVAAIDGTGLANGKAVGQATVTADLGGLSGQTTLTVISAVPVSIAISPLSASIAKGSGQRFSATATLSDGSSQDVTSLVAWTSSDRSGSGVASIDSSGLARGNSVGTAIISGAYRGNTATALLNVTAAVLTAVQVTPATVTLSKGTSRKLVATGFYSDGSSQDVSSSAVWTASDLVGTAVAAVGSGGQVAAKAVGKSTITATTGGFSGSAVVEVIAPAYTGLQVDPGVTFAAAGGTVQFRTTATRSDGSTQDVTALTAWSIAPISSAFFSIDSKGLVTVKGSGLGIIQASFAGYDVSAQLLAF